MKYVFVLVDKNKKTIAIYDNEEFAKKLQKPIEEKLKVELTIERRSLNLPLDLIGVFE